MSKPYLVKVGARCGERKGVIGQGFSVTDCATAVANRGGKSFLLGKASHFVGMCMELMLEPTTEVLAQWFPSDGTVVAPGSRECPDPQGWHTHCMDPFFDFYIVREECE